MVSMVYNVHSSNIHFPNIEVLLVSGHLLDDTVKAVQLMSPPLLYLILFRSYIIYLKKCRMYFPHRYTTAKH